MLGLTEQQRRVLEFIFDQTRTQGSAPTLREIAAHFGWKAVGSAQDIVTSLKKKGALLAQEPGRARQLVLTPEAQNILRYGNGNFEESASESLAKLRWIPIVGMVQAGNPHEAIPHESEKVPFYLPNWGKASSDFFAVEVEGYSMVNAGFLPGDVLLVERNTQATNGQIVVAAVNLHEATVKRYATKGSELYREAMQKSGLERGPLPPAFLVPENPVFEVIPFGTEPEARILGVVRSLTRRQIH